MRGCWPKSGLGVTVQGAINRLGQIRAVRIFISEFVVFRISGGCLHCFTYSSGILNPDPIEAEIVYPHSGHFTLMVLLSL
jgi:hypothetical protein